LNCVRRRFAASVGAPRSAVEELDWHHIAKERFVGEISKELTSHPIPQIRKADRRLTALRPGPVMSPGPD
jgi:hypothetical protein